MEPQNYVAQIIVAVATLIVAITNLLATWRNRAATREVGGAVLISALEAKDAAQAAVAAKQEASLTKSIALDLGNDIKAKCEDIQKKLNGGGGQK